MIIKGKGFWCKIVGAPGWGYKNQHKEWSMDLSISDETETALLNAGMDPSYVKDKGDEKGKYLTFRRRELRADGTPGKPIEIVDRNGQAWDGKTLIGNGSLLKVKIAMNDLDGKKTKKPGLIKVLVHELVPFEGREGDDEELVSSDDEKWD